MNVSIARSSGPGALREKERFAKSRNTFAKGRSCRTGALGGDRKEGLDAAALIRTSKKDSLRVNDGNEGSGLRRRDAGALSLALALSTASGSANAAVPKGYSPVKNTQKGYAFLYPFGWQEVSVDGAEVTYKDIIEPLESISLEILPTNKTTIEEFGPVDKLSQTLVKQVLVPPTQEGEVLQSSMVSGRNHHFLSFIHFTVTKSHSPLTLIVLQRENEGITYYTIEYTAKARTFVRHSLTALAVQRGKADYFFPLHPHPGPFHPSCCIVSK